MKGFRTMNDELSKEADMNPIRIARSFIAAESVADMVAAEYDCPPPISARLFSKLLRTQDNDHYLVTAGDGTQYAFRIYQQGDRFHRAESVPLLRARPPGHDVRSVLPGWRDVYGPGAGSVHVRRAGRRPGEQQRRHAGRAPRSGTRRTSRSSTTAMRG